MRQGDVIAGKFRIERTLGEGGMGYVMAARHLQLDQTVALKFMRDEVCTPDYRSRFLREARNTVRLKSKHVSRVLDVGTLDDGVPYMVMEYLDGRDLSDLLHERGPFAVHEACEYVLQACEAIAEAHSLGIVHRDLKPANLFLTRGQGGDPVIKVLDFGVSKVTALELGTGGHPSHDVDSVVTKASDLLGSPGYMAPEQIVSAKDADARSDIWSLGVILFRLVSGRAPFASPALGELIQQIVHGPIPSLRDARPDIPQGLEHVVARCLERDRQRRLGDAGELARMLAPYAGPVAMPSLERIAILGPALVTQTQPRPSFANTGAPGSGSGAMAVSAWSRPPPPPPPPPGERSRPNAVAMLARDPRTMSGVALGLIMAAAIVLVAVAILVAKRKADNAAFSAGDAEAALSPPATAPAAEPASSPASSPAPAPSAAPTPPKRTKPQPRRTPHR